MCNAASLLWFARFDMSSYGGAQLLSCSYLVNHTSIMLISQANLIGKMSSRGE